MNQTKLDAAQLIEAAQQGTGLVDWGDGNFAQHFAILVNALNNEARLHQVGRRRVAHRLDMVLRARLGLVADRKRFPGIAAERVAKPIIVIGLPRAGTTFMHNLLSSDPAHRSPLSWEIMFPSPPPEQATYRSDARAAQAQAAFDAEGFLKPEVQACHPWNALAAEECNFIWELSMLSVDFPAWWNIPSYAKHLQEADFRDVYQCQKEFLQHAQHRNPGERWVLKSPAHMIWLEECLSVFPDACFVVCHRDPVKALASLSSLLREMQSLFTDAVPSGDFGMTELNAYGMNKATEFRERPEYKDRFFDAHFSEVQKDPMAVARAIYAHFDLPLGAEREAVMAGWLKQDRERHARTSRHAYSVDDSGLDPAKVDQYWGDYIKRYGVALER